MAAVALLVSLGGLAAPAQAAGVTVKIGKPRVTPAAYTGDCPITTDFSARVAVRGAGRITYRWVGSGGVKSKVMTARVTSGSALVRGSRTFRADAAGWQALQVLSPRKATSAKAAYSVSCAPIGDVTATYTHDPSPAVRVSAEVADVAPYSGACPLPGRAVTFTGTIKGGPAAYRWADSDGGAQPVERLTSGTRVTSTRTFLTSATGTRWLELLDAKGRVVHRSNRAAYRVTCTPPPQQDPARAAVSNVRVTPAAYDGVCDAPLDFTFTADLAVTKPAKVTYRWVRGDGEVVPGAFTFTKDLSTSVKTTWKVADPSKLANGSARLEILTPNAVKSAPATFTIKCAPITLSQTLISSRSTKPGPCDTTTNPHWFTASAQARALQRTEISFRWRWSDGGFSRTETAVIDGTRTFSYTWAPRSSKTGKVWLEVLEPGNLTSPPADFSVVCNGQPPTDPGGSVVAVRNTKVTPDAHQGACPVTLTFSMDITVSGPLTEPVTFTWYYDDANRSMGHQQVSFAKGEPLTKTVTLKALAETTTNQPRRAYVEIFTPNMAWAEPVFYKVTCS
ncbi:hypothetical protein HII36_32070 [Nonomuraea sp. NN258]|uniref:hypothetical protein n=1 Tax=Nonomuraea antri TaxID=2730852 RepID=UPI0015684946|nr:hypothetical protein [Nonomuraea antri]NRQ36436.1 hypothetical protein [Nonomuraea antri]